MKKVGSWWLPDEEQHLVKYILRDDSYQKDLREHALSFVKEFRTALDIGAHVGLWTRDLAERFNKVVAFEPIFAHIECFNKNVVAPNVLLYPTALTDNHLISPIYFETDKNSTGGARVTRNKSRHSVYPITLHRIAEVTAEIDFIKIDCEGYEYFILKGGEKLILRDRPIINIEQKARTYPGIHRYSACEYLESLGMKLLGNMKDEFVYGWEA